MRGRVVTLIVALLAGAGTARAHNLNGEYRVLPGKTVRVESWFETGEAPKSAQVQVIRANGEVLAQGGLSSQGMFVFRYEEPEALDVVIDARDHRKKLAIAAGELAPAEGAEKAPAPVERASSVAAKDVLLGATFLLALAAFALSRKNARRLKAFEARP